LGGLTNLAASLGGPVGLAAGVAAAGIGLVFAAVKGEAEKAKAKIDELRGALEDVGDLAGEEAKKAIFKTWLTSAQETTGKIEAVDGALRDAGVSAGDFHDALAGDPAAIERVRRGLQLQGSEIIKNKEQTGKITDEQQKYLDTFPDILHDIGASDKALGAVRREHEAIENLSGDTAKNADKTADNLDTAAGKAGKLADEMDDAARDRTISIRFKYPGGRIPGFGLPNRPGSVTVTVPKAAAMTSTYAAPPQVQAAPPVIVTEEQIYRAVSRLLMRGEARNGRRVVWG
jgi:methyl-accepting chemotaxis protein